MKLPEFDLDKYNSDDAEEHRIKILSEYLLECVKNRGDNFDDLILLDDFQIEDFYCETVAAVKRYYYTLNNWDYEKEKLMKSLTMSIARTKDLVKTVKFPNENWEQTEEEILADVKQEEVKLDVLNKTYSQIKWLHACEYNAQIDNYWKSRERKKLGYKVMVEFRRLIREYNKIDIPELDFSDNSDKVKLIILEKLGIIDYIKSIQSKPQTISHTSVILSAITGIESKTLNTYLYPMLRPHRDDDHKESPYKNPDNLLSAEKALHKFKIKNTDANR